MSDARTSERITVYSDYVCPFCYLGRRSLEQYQNERDDPLTIDWQPFDLRAGERGPGGEIDESADDGKDEGYYEQARENVRRLAAQYDVEMELDLATDVDSLNAQVVAYRVKEGHPYERWLDFDVAVFEALWRDGRDIGDPAVLVDLAEDAGLDGAEIREVVADDEVRATVEERFAEARQQGITGVPTFAYGEHGARGAVPPEHLKRLVEGT